MSEMLNFNAQVIEEFRANDGRVGGPFEGAAILLLTTTGARSGAPYTTPVMYRTDGDRYVIFGSNAGASSHPAWYHNLSAHPDATIELPSETIAVTAADAAGEERDRLYAAQAADSPQFAEYQVKTDRVIPVVLLTPAR
jgi:deazaflavin-dependent oxidoreductase (nitroreductase family)